VIITIKPGQQYDVLGRDEYFEHQAGIARAREREAARGVKWMRLPEVVRGVASGSALSIGGGTEDLCGPQQGYCWSIRRLLIAGLASGATPDIVNFYFDDTGTQPKWQLNGNSFGVTFGRAEFMMMGGQVLLVKSVGTFNSTATIIVSGDLIEVPQEEIWKLVE
jgi:hypothetical protein